jgi:hypothetical protein
LSGSGHWGKKSKKTAEEKKLGRKRKRGKTRQNKTKLKKEEEKIKEIYIHIDSNSLILRNPSFSRK